MDKPELGVESAASVIGERGVGEVTDGEVGISRGVVRSLLGVADAILTGVAEGVLKEDVRKV